jgi:hypothetical protein
LYIDATGSYYVFLPALTENTLGPSWVGGSPPGTSLPINDFYVAHEGVDNSSSLNAALESGKHLLITPGKYRLAEAQGLARQLAGGPSFAHAVTKQMLHREWNLGVDAAIEAEARAQARCMQTRDFRRAYEAFVAKRTPEFKGD